MASFCPVCPRTFQTKKGLNNHLKNSQSCKWYRRGKLREFQPVPLPLDSEDHPTMPPSSVGGLTGPSSSSLPRDGYHPPQADDTPDWLQDMDWDAPIPDTNFDAFIPPAEAVGIGEAGPGPATLHARSRTPVSVETAEPEDDEIFVVEDRVDGRIVRMDESLHQRWRDLFGEPEGTDNTVLDPTHSPQINHFSPFASEMDWRVANWVVREDPGHGAFNRLLEVPGVAERLGLSYSNVRGLHTIVDSIPDRAGQWYTKRLSFPDRRNEIFIIHHRNVIEAIRCLWGDPNLSQHMVYRPRKIFRNRCKDTRIYNEMWTGKWWHAVQSQLPAGATVAPIIIATDKTQLTQFVGGKSAYPVYITLGNIPKAIRRQPSQHPCVLLGYLPVNKIDAGGITEREQRSRTHTVFHKSMRLILEPLVEAGASGIELTGGDGAVRKVYPILAAYVADFPEQCLVTCSKYGTCPKCQCPADKLGLAEALPSRTSRWTLEIFRQAESYSTTDSAFHTYCMDHNVSSSTTVPFWHDLPFADIHMCITADVLHQLYQGVFKHLVNWVKQIMTPEELDARIRCLPPGYGVRHFKHGISNLSQISGTERKQMAKILLGCLVGAIPDQGVRACRAILDFIYLSQYPSHDDDTLAEMKTALDTWHANSSYFIDVGVREDFHIPKFHSLRHYVRCIELLGTTDGYNTEMFERLHIDFAKAGWRASNRRDEFPQMITWLSRREKVTAFEAYTSWAQAQLMTGELDDPAENAETRSHGDSIAGAHGNMVMLAKYPQRANCPLDAISEQHCAPNFIPTLKQYLATLLQNRNIRTTVQNTLPFRSLSVFTQIKLRPPQLDIAILPSFETIKAIPRSQNSPGQFDTVVVLSRSDALTTGVTGTRVGRVRVIFKLPTTLDYGLGDAPSFWPKSPLVYVEWYTKFKSEPHRSSCMYTLKRQLKPDGTPVGAILGLDEIRQSYPFEGIFSFCLGTFLRAPSLPSLIEAATSTQNLLTAVNMVVFGLLGYIPSCSSASLPDFHTTVVFSKSKGTGPVTVRFMVVSPSDDDLPHQLGHFLVTFYLTLVKAYPDTKVSKIRSLIAPNRATGYMELAGNFPNLKNFVDAGGLNSVDQMIHGYWSTVDEGDECSVALMNECIRVSQSLIDL